MVSVQHTCAGHIGLFHYSRHIHPGGNEGPGASRHRGAGQPALHAAQVSEPLTAMDKLLLLTDTCLGAGYGLSLAL